VITKKGAGSFDCEIVRLNEPASFIALLSEVEAHVGQAVRIAAA